MYMKYKKCSKKEYHIEENRKQGVISDRQRWCECQKRKEEEVVYSQENQKVQQREKRKKGTSGEHSKF